MKILVVVPDMLLGGVTSSAINFCKECQKRGNEVDILVMDGTESNIPEVNQIGLKRPALLWNLSAKQLKNKSLIAKISLAAVAIIKKITNHFELWLPLVFHGFKIKGSYDVAVAYRQCAPCYYFTLKCVNARRKIAMIHGDLNFMRSTNTWDKYFPYFNKISCVSKAVTEGFKQKFQSVAEKFTTIYNMFDVEDIQGKALQTSPYSVNPSVVNIITVSRHENCHKKVDRVVKASAELRKQDVENFHWYVVGDGPDFDYNCELANELGVSDLITFCGAMENPFALQSKCDFSVLLSATEAYGMAVIESQILGKPIIAMQYPALNEIMQDEYNGLIAEQTVFSLTQCLKKLIENERLRKILTENVQKDRYSNNIAYQQFIDAVQTDN